MKHMLTKHHWQVKAMLAYVKVVKILHKIPFTLYQKLGISKVVYR